MSTTPAPAPADGPPETQDRSARALRLFDDLLFDHPGVCSSCYARIRDRTEHDEAVLRAGRLGTGNRPTETLQRAGDGEVGQDCRDHDEYGVRRSYFGRTYCGQCGAPGGTASPERIASLQALRGQLDAIVRRLHEQNFYPDIDTLYRTAIHLKQQPEHQGRDRQLLAAATYLALERGGEAPDLPGLVRPGDPRETDGDR